MSTCLCKLNEPRHEPREQLFLYARDLGRSRVGMLCYLTRKTICPLCTRGLLACLLLRMTNFVLQGVSDLVRRSCGCFNSARVVWRDKLARHISVWIFNSCTIFRISRNSRKSLSWSMLRSNFYIIFYRVGCSKLRTVQISLLICWEVRRGQRLSDKPSVYAFSGQRSCKVKKEASFQCNRVADTISGSCNSSWSTIIRGKLHRLRSKVRRIVAVAPRGRCKAE